MSAQTKKGLTRIGTLWKITRAPSSCLPPDRRTVPPLRIAGKVCEENPVAEKEGIAASMELDREVIRCGVCGLVQYRTRTGNCRRCLRLLPPKVTFVIPTPSPTDLPGDDRQLFENWPNRETVENIGQRIRQLRESRGMTQSQLQARSRVSRSYLSARRRPEPLLRSRDERRDGARRPVHSGLAALPAPAGLDAMAGHPEKAAGHQRTRQHEPADTPARPANGRARTAWPAAPADACQRRSSLGYRAEPLAAFLCAARGNRHAFIGPVTPGRNVAGRAGAVVCCGYVGPTSSLSTSHMVSRPSGLDSARGTPDAVETRPKVPDGRPHRAVIIALR
jgi:hypothetical protein